MKWKSNETLGVILMVLALMLAFAAWALSPSLGITAFALFFIGAHLFYTERMQRRTRPPSSKDASGASAQQDVPSV